MEGDVTIRDVMSREYVGVSESDSVRGAVQLMRDEREGSVVVLRGTDPVGILTEWDILGLITDDSNPEDTTVSEVMSTPVVSMDANRSMADAAAKMSKKNIRRILVTNDEEIVGVLTERDIISASASLAATSVQDVNPLEVTAEPAASETPGGDEYSSQGICEVCGSLTRDLANFNGQLICSNCREV